MLRDKINYEELKLLREIPLLLKLRLKKVFGKRTKNDGGILVINACIIGDFLATLPALRLFIEKQGRDIDLVVTPPVKPLAEAMKGVARVFTAKSIYQRSNESGENRETIPTHYSQVMVLRISHDAFTVLNNIEYSNIEIYDVQYFKYCVQLITSILLKRDVKQWGQFNCEIIGVKQPDRKIGIDDIFRLSESEYERIREMPEMNTPGIKIIIHTGSGWKVKLWDNDKWIELLQNIHTLGACTFIFVGNSDLEEQSFEYIQNNLDFKIFSIIKKADLKTVLLMMRLSDYFIGVDSGPRNLAHLADLRSISMLGPAPKNFMPRNKEDIVIDKFTCRCKSLYYLHNVSAMQKISADEVFNGFRRLSLASGRGTPGPA